MAAAVVQFGIPNQQRPPGNLHPGANLLPVPIITRQADYYEHFLALGYDNRNGIEFAYGDCSAAVSASYIPP